MNSAAARIRSLLLDGAIGIFLLAALVAVDAFDRVSTLDEIGDSEVESLIADPDSTSGVTDPVITGKRNDPVLLAAKPGAAVQPKHEYYAENSSKTAPPQIDVLADRPRPQETFGSAPAEAPMAQPEQAALAAEPAGNSEGTTFFNVKSRGDRFVYIVDCSGSMFGKPFKRARLEVIRTIGKLKEDQSFYVMFFNGLTFCQFNESGPPENMISANASNKRKLVKWVNDTRAGGGTSPEQALMWALRLQPDAILLMTDGNFDEGTVGRITAANRTRIPIHTFAFLNEDGGPLLRAIADKNGGKYTFVER